MELGRSQVVLTTCVGSRDGFTLIEVLIALTIFTIGILGISGMLLIGEQGIATGNKSLSAVQISRAQMEHLRGDSNIETGSGECTALYFPEIQCQWTIRGDTPAADLYEIEVRATWNEGDKKRELELKTLRFIK
ncbi:MAG: prepilin-type N-terminal cleavage/methylation domain-containing protein [Nitrospirae bacterium]|nr:prepilin-type N-terminal cleavage/methylation domain-containing protein [Nitrospirota bacterium]